MITCFANEAFTDFNVAENVNKMELAIKLVKSQFGKTYPIIIGGKKITTNDLLISTNPSNPSEIIGKFSKANVSQVNEAIELASQTFTTWSRVSAEIRSRYILRLANLMKEQKYELSAYLILEIGKSYAEADGDVAEAIDFCEFYAREMMRLAQMQPLIHYPGEENQLTYEALGVVCVIPPWNFPLAILVGMTVAAIVSGNTVVLKPSSETPMIAYKFFELMESINLPNGVLNFVPCSGSEVGDNLITHPKTRAIAFTGSKEVGLRINHLASSVSPGQKWIKRCVLEMGGKDSIVVDSNTDLNKAATAIVASAFGFQGQKCSACSRAIIHETVYAEMVKLIVEKTQNLKIGDVAKSGIDFGPVSSKSAYKSILEYIEIAKSEGKILTGGNIVKLNDGYFIEPTVVGDVDPLARISQEEIFGPVLALVKAKNFFEAIDIANNTEYGLTGGVFTNNREYLEYARVHFHVGNLYLNRKCTGALVGVQPFGGFNMSGTDSKAGGRDYLLLFTQGKVVAERF